MTDDRAVVMPHETEVFTGEAGREVAETAALLLFMASGISAVLLFCVSPAGGVPLAALLGVAAVAGFTGSVFCLHRLGRHTQPCAGSEGLRGRNPITGLRLRAAPPITRLPERPPRGA